MAGGTGTVLVGRRILMGSGCGDEFSDNMVFGFLEEGEGSLALESYGINGGSSTVCNFDEEEDDENSSGDAAESKDFWEEKHQLLQAILRRTTSLESRVRGIAKEVLRESELVCNKCTCKGPIINGGCRTCLLQQVSDHLRSSGFNSTLCNSKWRKSPHMLPGEHTYVEVLERSGGRKKGEAMRVIVELDFRSEFEMARGSEDYNRLINQIPQVFVGKAERLMRVIKIMCCAAKKCMEEKKMHMGPWREHKYMKAKWFGIGTCSTEKRAAVPLVPTEVSQYHHQPPHKPKASMLTIEMLSCLHHCTAVAVV